MLARTTRERLRTIQRALNVEPDGVLGPQTLTALEAALEISGAAILGPVAGELGMVFSRDGVETIVRFEIGSNNYYNTHLRKPHWPGGDSGVTIGIGYDLGYQSREQFHQDWSGELPDVSFQRLEQECGRKGKQAKQRMEPLLDISVSLNRARRVFTRSSLKAYAGKTKRAFPGVAQLLPDAQAALVSLVYNRGTAMRGDSRREMRELRDHVGARDYGAMAQCLLDMKRLWEGRNLDGLLKRRDREAQMLLGAQRQYDAGEVISL